ncbi:hypothetical protein ILYODFUR_033712 [Ilyodon furcidens]|uniref:Secreted protein n=1 Tax=Ilyodon furcidens TaxID=33524 RepID=A0ABV0SRC3_9TELE
MCILVPVSLVSIIVAESSLLCHFFTAQRSAVFMELLCHLVCCFVDVGVCLGAAPSCFCSAMEAITAQEDYIHIHCFFKCCCSNPCTDELMETVIIMIIINQDIIKYFIGQTSDSGTN